MKRTNNILNIKGIGLEQNKLYEYMEKIASEHNVINKSSISTFPIPRLKDNFNFISKTYQLLNFHINKGIGIYPAGEWLLDNFYSIEESYKYIISQITKKKYKNLNAISNAGYYGFARVAVLASEIVAYTDNIIKEENIKIALSGYQRKKTLSMDEMWNLSIFLQISLIEKIRGVCEKIYSSQIQKYKVENIVERLVERKDNKAQIFPMINDNMIKRISYKEMKYPFIEYMSYKLKKYGKQGLPYLKILEEQVNKMGTDVSDVINKEHFEIASNKVTIGNCITSIKQIMRINFLDIYEKVGGIEELLKKDPANVYEKMDYKTKEFYRNTIQELSKKTKISEIYITKKVLELASSEDINSKKAHIGYYLIKEGKKKLYNVLTGKKYNKVKNDNIYILAFYLLSFFISAVIFLYEYTKFNNLLISLLITLVSVIPISEIALQLINYILSKITKPKIIPKLDFEKGVPKDCATMVIIPTILKDKERVKELIRKLEVYYLANKSENMYFTLLGDASASGNEKEDFDKEIIEIGREKIEKLNKKYNCEIFNFAYRKRKWNAKEKCYLGWERKRGLICEWNKFLKTGEHDFLENTIKTIPKIKYIITLDADTNLVLNSGLELIGAMAHILNKPIIDSKKNIVIDGYGIIQPRVGIDLISVRKTLFTRIFAGIAGTDCYTNAISDIYQDNFNEGIFTGKGIYDLDVFYKVLSNTIPEDTVLSHDLLEGSYLRCGLATDILLLDGYPTKYNAFMSRAHRWIRGDWQIALWLKNRVLNGKKEYEINPINNLSKFKILDNLRRSLVPIFIVIMLIISCFNINNMWLITTISLVSLLMPMILEILNSILFKQDVSIGSVIAYKSFTPTISGVKSIFIRAYLEFSFLPHKAYTNLNAIVKTIYRMNVTKQNLLEWTTAEETEKNSKTDLLSYYKNMFFNVVIGIIFILLQNPIFFVFGIVWLIAPSIACNISKEKNKKIKYLNESDMKYILTVGKDTWNFFNTYVNEENNYLPPDNYQEDRNEKIANRTSPTNIGLGLLSIISAYDLKYIDIDTTINLIEKMLFTIDKLQKWNGHLYNWYNTKTLEPLYPRYISTVDNGNFIGYLYVVKQFLIDINKENTDILINLINNIINNTDFSILYDEQKQLFSIGFNIEENTLTDSYYDLLASEARQASFIAIAKKDVPSRHWNSLSRTLTTLNRYKGLISWSGTAFEYLMPNINMNKYPGSLLDESCKFMIMSQKEYAKRAGMPWGISESAFAVKDLNNNYQYKAFGIPWLGLKRGLADERVVSSYGTILAISEDPKGVVENLKILQKNKMYDKYGFYEALDYTVDRLKYGEKNKPVKTYMAHHQGLILISINNFINSNIIQKRFIKNPEIEATDILLQERMPEKTIITKETKEKIQKQKSKELELYTEKQYIKIDNVFTKTNIISNGEYTICTKDNGTGFSKYKDILVNKFKKTADYEQGVLFFLKDIKTKRIWSNSWLNYLDNPDKYQINFAQDKTKITRVDGPIETTTKVTVSPDDNLEIRRLILKNLGNIEEEIEITSFLEPVLSNEGQEYSHPAFNNLFLTYEFLPEENIIIAKRKKREQSQKDIYLGVSFNVQGDTIGELEFELDKEKFLGRENIGLPKMVKESKHLSKTIGIFPESAIILKRILKIKPEEKVTLDYNMAIDYSKEEVVKKLKKYNNINEVSKVFDLSRAKVEASNIYLGLKGKDVETYQKIISLLLFSNPFKAMKMNNIKKQIYEQKELWKFGISGDNPIAVVKIKDINDIYVLNQMLKAYEFIRTKNIKIDLVIINQEKNSYEQYLKEGILLAILNKQLAFMQNVNGGIFVLQENEMQNEDKDLFEFRANLIIEADKGDIDNQIKELEEEYIDTVKNIGEDKIEFNNNIEESSTINLEKEELSYYNEYGGFYNNGKEYKFKTSTNNKLPTVWSHVLANENFGTVVTQNMGGYTWSKNSRLNRITAWNNNQVQDIPSEIIYVKDKNNGKIWSLSNNMNTEEQEFYVTYGFGYANYKTICDGILQEAEIFVPRKDKVKVNIIKFKNLTNAKKKLKIIYYIKPVLGEDEIKSNGYIDIEKNNNAICAKNLYNGEFASSVYYISTNRKIETFTGSKKSFIGNKNLLNPESISKVSLDNSIGLGIDSCIAIQLSLEIEPYKTEEFCISLGEEESNIDAKNMAYKYSNIINCKEENKEIKKYWYELLNKIEVNTPIESMNIMLNGWTMYQTIASRLWGKTGYYQSGGAFGFRDQLQDSLSFKLIEPNKLKEQIIKHAKHQFEEGDVEHWWHEDTKMGIRTRFSDDLLWLVYAVNEYCLRTSDYEILDIDIPYIEGDVLKDGEDEKYDKHIIGKKSDNLYMHCIKAIEKSLNFGKNLLPKIGSGDWNDGLNLVGNKGRGESVWLGFFLYDILNKFIPIIQIKGESKRATKYEEIKNNLKKALNQVAWDGRWFKRAFTDDGHVLGSIENEECKIDSIAQSWGIISNAADNDKKYIAMESLENHLIDKENGIIKLLDPPFEKSNLEPGYIKAYLPGVRENGGQYTHEYCC